MNNMPIDINSFRYNPQPLLQRYEIIKVNGEAGARSFRMLPNSNTLLLDENAPIVWLAQTDGAGYMTVTPYDLQLHVQPEAIDINSLVARIQHLEEELINVRESNSQSNKQSKKQRPQQPTSIVDTTNQGFNATNTN